MHPLLEAKARELEETGDAVIITTVDGIILSWNERAEALYGWRSDEVLGRQILGVTPTNLSMGEGARILSQLQQGTPWQGAFSVQHRGGEQIHAEVLDVPVQDAGGTLLGIVGVSRRSGADGTADR